MCLYTLLVDHALQTRVRVVIDEEQKLMSEWSDEFSLDAVGSEGIFKCEVDDSDRVYQVEQNWC